MNKLVLIGNGFDLAHGLKTKYSDFLTWYLDKTVKSLAEKCDYDDPLWKVSANIINKNIRKGIKSIEHFKQFLKQNSEIISIQRKSILFENLIEEKINRPFWVDIESGYYKLLKDIYKQIEQRQSPNHELMTTQVIKLNNEFDFIKDQLHEYLISVESSKPSIIPDIQAHFNREFETPRTSIRFLNFNYTSTIEMYCKRLENRNHKVIYIHGKLNDERNPIIFGYGDEIDSYYQKIENINNNEYLKNFKSFGYFKTNNYQDFSRFIDSKPFKVYIMGHSCGLSDRTLLSQIVEHKNRRDIEIFYYNENDYTEKTQELSRHFSSKSKITMRTTIKTFLDSKPLVNIKK